LGRNRVERPKLMNSHRLRKSFIESTGEYPYFILINLLFYLKARRSV
jgi:hypothetical protein